MYVDSQVMFGVDKQMHFVSYAVVSLLVGLIVIIISDKHHVKRNINYAWLILVAVGTLEEYRQYFVPNRSAEFLDAVTNLIGVSVGLAVPLFVFYVVVKRIHMKLFVTYFVVLIPLFIGLLYLNERPFITFDTPIQEKMERFVAFIGFE